jgi:hypothetical protein
MNKPVLVFCSCIKVFAPTKISDPIIRKKHYVDSIKFFIANSKIQRIIIVENTNTNWVDEEILILAKNNNKIVEILLFKGDVDLAIKHSIGYSHFEMVYIAINNSQILKKNDSLLVMDGRYIIKNINLIYKKLINGNCAFMPEIHNFRKNNLCDLRLYLVSQSIFLNYIWTKRFDLSNKRNGWAEYIVDTIIKSKQFKIDHFRILPRSIGIQGSTGVNWDGNNPFYYYFKMLYIYLLFPFYKYK